MTLYWTFTSVYIISVCLLTKVTALDCFICNNDDNPSCGIYFKPYQFTPQSCEGKDYKCALQREPPTDNWVPIIRGCYQMGHLQDVNESNGCHDIVTAEFTYLFCLCDTDFCNSSNTISSSFITVVSYVLSYSFITYVLMHW